MCVCVKQACVNCDEGLPSLKRLRSQNTDQRHKERAGEGGNGGWENRAMMLLPRVFCRLQIFSRQSVFFPPDDSD